MTTLSRTARSANTRNRSQAVETTQKILAPLFPESNRDFAIRLWNGDMLPSAQGIAPQFTLVLCHPSSLRRMFWPTGELTLGEAYLRGDFDIEGDIIAGVRIAG